MLICWVVKTLMVPPLLMLSERVPRLGGSSEAGFLGRIRRFGMGYGRIFAWIVPKAPALFFGLGLVAIGLGAVVGVRYVRRDPMEYDLRAFENDPVNNAELHRVWDGVIDIIGGGNDGMLVLADTPDDAKALEQKIKADPRSAAQRSFESVHSLWDMVPDDQETKIPMLLEIGGQARTGARAALPERRRLGQGEGQRPPAGPEALRPRRSAADHRAPLTRRRTARAVASSSSCRSRATRRPALPAPYSDEFRETRLPNGKVVRGSGRAVIFADILKAVVHDVPRAVSLSLALTLLTVLLAFRRGGWHAASVLFALLVGVAGEAIFLYFAAVKINFLNFAALPITFGIGVDYAVNVAQRYRADGSRDILGALRTTGGAVVLCSLTTMLGVPRPRRLAQPRHPEPRDDRRRWAR